MLSKESVWGDFERLVWSKDCNLPLKIVVLDHHAPPHNQPSSLFVNSGWPVVSPLFTLLSNLSVAKWMLLGNKVFHVQLVSVAVAAILA